MTTEFLAHKEAIEDNREGGSNFSKLKAGLETGIEGEETYKCEEFPKELTIVIIFGFNTVE